MRASTGVLAFISFFTNIYARSYDSQSVSDLLSRLLGSSSSDSKPVIVLADPRDLLDLGENDDSRILNSDISGDLRDDEDTSDDQQAYLLYNVLRTQPQENLNADVKEKVEDTKVALYQALRIRCQNLESCVKKCLKKERKRKKCANVCQETFDEMDACDEPPPKCKKDKCRRGKTMPPHWL